jgi:hypothetical protein
LNARQRRDAHREGEQQTSQRGDGPAEHLGLTSFSPRPLLFAHL